MRQEMLINILNDLAAASGDIEASAIVSTDGLMIASVLPAGSDEDRIGAMSAAMLSLGVRTALELGRGALQQVMVRGAKGNIIMMHAGKDAVLSLLTRQQARLGLIFLDAQRAAESIAEVI